jgi:hypothetical protein
MNAPFGVIFHPKTARRGIFGCLLREINACNRVAAAEADRRAHISRNEPGV